MSAETCPNCGHDLTDDDEPEEWEPVVGAVCADCHGGILQGEWHELRISDDPYHVPNGTRSKITRGRAKDGERVCAECSDRDFDDLEDGLE